MQSARHLFTLSLVGEQLKGSLEEIGGAFPQSERRFGAFQIGTSAAAARKQGRKQQRRGSRRALQKFNLAV